MTERSESNSELLHKILEESLAGEDPKRIEQLLADDQELNTLVSEVRQAMTQTPLPDEAKLGALDHLKQAVVQALESSIMQSQDATVEMNRARQSEDWSDLFAAPEAEDEVGRLNKYRILQPLGKGGMGLVFVAEHLQLQRQVALKVIRPESANEQSRERFLREARLASSVEHDNICPIFDVGEHDNVAFLEMPLLQGETLQELMKRESPLAITDALRITREIAEGLSAAGAKGLVFHRCLVCG